MARRSLHRHVTKLAAATFVALVMGATINSASAASRKDRQDNRIQKNALDAAWREIERTSWRSLRHGVRPDETALGALSGLA